MGETTSGGDPQAEHRFPYWVVGLAFLAVVVIILAAAFLLNRQLRSPVGIQPLARTSASSVPAPAGHRGGASAITPRPVVTPAPTSMPTAAPTPILSPRQQVVQAYHRYWQDYGQALYTLNTSHLSVVAADGELQQVRAQVVSLREAKRAVRVLVSHHALIVYIKGNNATIYDEIRNRSFTINPITKQPPRGSSQADLERDLYYLRKIHGSWKVVKSLREEK